MSTDAGDAAATKSPETMDLDLNVTPSEESKGGIKYDVLIGEPKVVTPRMHATAGTVRPLSAEIIQLKITAAAERRKSLESLRLASLNDRLRRIEEAQKKRDEELMNFSTATKENLEQKIEASSANRETLILDMKTKLSSHNTNHLQEVRQNLMTNLTEFEEKAKAEIALKLEAAEKNREKVIQEKIESLKKHDEKVELIRTKRNSSLVSEEEVPQDPTAVTPSPPQL